MSNKNITSPTTSDYKRNPKLSYFVTKQKVKFSGSCLKQDKITYDHKTVVNICIVYEISKNFNLVLIQHWKSVYLEQLHELNRVILLSINILDMVLDLIEENFLHNLLVELVEM